MILHHMMHRTVGILHLSCKQFRTIPTDKKKFRGQKVYCMKKFTPFFNQYTGYYFWVKTNRIKDVIDQYVVIEFNISIDKENEVIGSVCRYIGEVGDSQIDSQLVRDIAISNWIELNNRPHAVAESISRVDLTPDRTNYLELSDPIISIDPEGCVDIDDAVSYRRLENGHRISIHIADPSSYLIEGSYMDEEIKKRAETVYLIDTTYHMFPQNLTTEFSLTVGKQNRAFTVHLILNECNQIIDQMIEKTLIRVDHRIVYEEFDHLITCESKTDFPLDMMRSLYDICRDLYKEFIDATVSNYSSKKMIEVLMVLANKTVAETMIRHNIEEPILVRSHVCKLHQPNKGNRMSELNNILQISSAELNLYDRNHIQRHEGLNLDHYTHFTSPIRRYSDILVHRALYNILNHRIFKNDLDQNIVNHMNVCKRHYKLVGRYDRMLRLYRVLETLIDEPKFEASIIMINEKDNGDIVLKIWIEDIYGEKDNIFSVKIIDRHMKTFRKIEIERTEQITSLYIINNDVEKKYELYQRIMVSLIIFPLQMERIQCIILE